MYHCDRHLSLFKAFLLSLLLFPRSGPTFCLRRVTARTPSLPNPTFPHFFTISQTALWLSRSPDFPYTIECDAPLRYGSTLNKHAPSLLVCGGGRVTMRATHRSQVPRPGEPSRPHGFPPNLMVKYDARLSTPPARPSPADSLPFAKWTFHWREAFSHTKRSQGSMICHCLNLSLSSIHPSSETDSHERLPSRSHASGG